MTEDPPEAPEDRTAQESARTQPVLIEGIEAAAEDFTALSHPHRLRLLHLLTRPLYGGELAEAMEMTRQNALKHVERLEERGFVRSMDGQRASGPVVEFQTVPQRLFELSVLLRDLGRLEPEGGPSKAHRASPTLDDQVPVPDQPPRHGVMDAQLLLLDGPGAGEVLALDREGSRWTIGRAEDRDLELGHDPYVSSSHAEIHVAPAGHTVVDVHSANGTFVNFDRLPSGGRVSLSPGDVIRVGHTHLVYQQAMAEP